MVQHAFELAPRHAAGLGTDGVRRAVDLAMDAAARQGFGYRGSTRLWVELAFMFGSGFADDPMLADVMAPLQGPRPATGDEQVERACLARQHADAFALAIAGEDGSRERLAFERCRHLSVAAIAGMFDDGAESAFRLLHPEKAAAMAPNAGRLILIAAENGARALALDGRHGTAALAVLMFLFGHRCAEDPLFPWIAAALNPSSAGSDDRIEKARRMTLRFLAGLGEG
jgi:hypothetical protein